MFFPFSPLKMACSSSEPTRRIIRPAWKWPFWWRWDSRSWATMPDKKIWVTSTRTGSEWAGSFSLPFALLMSGRVFFSRRNSTRTCGLPACGGQSVILCVIPV